MTSSRTVAVALALVAGGVGAGVIALSASDAATRQTTPSAYAPHIDPARFVPAITHPYLPLTPGVTWRYRGRADGREIERTTTVLHETRTIMGVACTVVHDVESAGGRVVEDTYDWFAQDDSGTVWCFGEDTRERTARGGLDSSGSWRAGERGAQPGVLLPGRIAPGTPYRQEYLAGRAEDMGKIEAVRDTARVPFGAFTECVRTRDWSLLEPGHEFKWYARGTGEVRSRSSSGEYTELFSMTRP